MTMSTMRRPPRGLLTRELLMRADELDTDQRRALDLFVTPRLGMDGTTVYLVSEIEPPLPGGER